MNQILVRCLAVVSIIGFVLGFGAYLLGDVLLTIYSTDPQVISAGLIRLSIVSASYFLCGIMDVIVGSLRGMGYSMMPMLISLTGACLFRVIWIFTVFQMNHSPLCSLYFLSNFMDFDIKCSNDLLLKSKKTCFCINQLIKLIFMQKKESLSTFITVSLKLFQNVKQYKLIHVH